MTIKLKNDFSEIPKLVQHLDKKELEYQRKAYKQLKDWMEMSD